MKYLLRPGATAYLHSKGLTHVGENRLADLAYEGRSPEFSMINGRACYTVEALDAWIAEEAAKPRRTRKPRTASERTAA
jgi:hypothetical protein